MAVGFSFYKFLRCTYRPINTLSPFRSGRRLSPQQFVYFHNGSTGIRSQQVRTYSTSSTEISPSTLRSSKKAFSLFKTGAVPLFAIFIYQAYQYYDANQEVIVGQLQEKSARLRINLTTLFQSLSRKECEELLRIFITDIETTHSEQSTKELRKECFAKAYEAFKNRDWEKIRKIPSIDRLVDENGATLFLAAIREGNGECVREFSEEFQYSPLLYQSDFFGNTPHHYAAIYNQPRLVDLLSNFCAAKERNTYGKTAAELSIDHRSAELSIGHELDKLNKSAVLKELIRVQGNLDAEGLVRLAITNGQTESLEVVLTQDKSKNREFLKKRFVKGNNLLHLAIEAGQKAIIEHLLTIHISSLMDLLDAENNEGYTPFHFACMKGDESTIRLLDRQYFIKDSHNADQGSLINHLTKEGYTGVHLAVLHEHPNIISVLYQLGANLEKSGEQAKKPSVLAEHLTKNPKSKICAALLEKYFALGKRAADAPPNYIEFPPENLVFKGGGIKGIAYVAVLKEMEKRHLLQNVRRIAGTSAGSIVAGLLAVGYTPDEIEKELQQESTSQEKGPDDFFDYQSVDKEHLVEKLGGSRGVVDAAKAVVTNWWERVKKTKDPIGSANELYQELYKLEGVCEGDVLLKWIEKRIAAKTGKNHCTFKELRDLSRTDSRFKELYVITVQSTQPHADQPITLSAEDPAYEDLVVSEAIRCSVSIPGVFKPHTPQFKRKDTLETRSSLKNCADGGLLRNYHLSLFDETKYQADSAWGKVNKRTLGFHIKAEQATEPKSDTMDLVAVMSTLMNYQEILTSNMSHRYDEERTLTVKVPNIGATTKLSGVTKKQLLDAGKESFTFWIGSQSQARTV